MCSSDLAKEEEDILPIASELLGPEDWAAVAMAVPAAPDPLFGDECEPRYDELRREIEAAIART